jgi:small subunit ribosomal protein S3
VDRPGNKLRITIHTSRPGIIIGRKGAEIEKLKADLAKKTKREIFIDIQEVHKPELDAQLVSESIALQLEKRVAFRRAMRKAVDSALRFGCKGIKVRVSGRLNGAEIARTEWYLQGQLPLHTLRADIDYGFTEAHTTYGVIGIKCWVYKGEILPGGKKIGLRNDPEPRRAPARDRRDRDGRDNRGGDRDRGGDRGGDRGAERAPRPAPIAEQGGVIQAAPSDMPSRTASPILPPMAAPTQPSWKQESRPATGPAAEPKPAAESGEKSSIGETRPGGETSPEGAKE